MSLNAFARRRLSALSARVLGRKHKSSLNYLSFAPIEPLESRILMTAYPAAADVYVRDGSWGSTNYNSSTQLQTKNDAAAGYARQSYLRFDTTSFSEAVGTAKLRLYGGPSHSDAVQVNLYPIADTTWSESTLTWNTRPVAGATVLASVTVQGTSDGWYEWDVTSYIQQEKAAGRHAIGFALKNPNASVPFVHFNPKESSSNDPELVLDAPAQSIVVSTNAISANEGSGSAFTVKLGSQPTSDVTVAVAKQAGGDADLTATPTTLTFTTANWNTAQSVTVSAAQDADGTVGTATFVVSAAGLTSQNVVATEVDDDLQSLAPSNDAYVLNGSPTTNYGQDVELRVKFGASTNTRETFLKFPISSISSVGSATLRLFGSTATNTATLVVNGHSSTTTSWAEDTITWNNRPTNLSGILDSVVVATTTDQWYEFDVSSFVQQQKLNGATDVTLVLRGEANNDTYATFDSDEVTNAANRPRLVVTPDGTAQLPAAPTNLTATPGTGSIALAWTASAGAASYNVYRGTTPGGQSATPIATGLTTASYTDSTAAPGQPYYYTVKAVNTAGVSAASNEATATSLPAVPTGVTVTATGDDLTITWQPVAGATAYQILRDGNSVFASTNASTFTISDPDRPHDTTQSYTVKAFANEANSESSALVSADTIPVAPTLPGATTSSATQVDLVWTDVSVKETRFEIDRLNVATSASTPLAHEPANDGAATDTGLSEGTTYRYTIASANAAGRAINPPTVDVTTRLLTPTGLSASPASSTQINLTWGDASGKETGYQVMWSPNGLTDWVILPNAIAAGATSFTDTDRIPSTSYSYRVRAVNTTLNVTSDWSNITSATTPAQPAAPTATIGGPLSINEGATYTLTLTSSDPANTTGWTINWGDGSQSVQNNPASVTHAYADGPASYNVTATATISGTPYASNAVTVSVANLPPANVVISGPANGIVGAAASYTASATDAAGAADPMTFSWSVTGPDLQSPQTGTGASFAFTPPAQGEYLVSLTASDGDGGSTTTTKTVISSIPTVNEAPVVQDATFSVSENSSPAPVVGTVSASDPNAGQTLTYAIAGGNDDSAFAINASTGQITVYSGSNLNHEAVPSRELTITVTDNGTPVLSDSAVITINVTDVNERPVALGATLFVPENTRTEWDEDGEPHYASVGRYAAAVDPDAGQTLTYSIVAGNGDGSFGIDSSSGLIWLAAGLGFDHEATPVKTIVVRSTDNGSPLLYADATVTVNVIDVDEGRVTIIPLINPSFEDPMVLDANGHPQIPGWKVDRESDLQYAFETPNLSGTEFPGAAPDGDRVLRNYLVSRDIFQTAGLGQEIPVHPVEEVIYTVTAKFRADKIYMGEEGDLSNVLPIIRLGLAKPNNLVLPHYYSDGYPQPYRSLATTGDGFCTITTQLWWELGTFGPDFRSEDHWLRIELLAGINQATPDEPPLLIEFDDIRLEATPLHPGFDLDTPDINESAEEAQGLKLHLNNDRDEQNVAPSGSPRPDNLPDADGGDHASINDNDLEDATLRFDGTSGGTWRLDYPESVMIWRQEGENLVEVESGISYPAPTSAQAIPLKVEGLRSSLTPHADVIVATLAPAVGASVTDTLGVNVSGIDLQIDSDNDDNWDLPEGDLNESELEGQQSQPGKILYANTHDVDDDDIVDLADGFNRDGILGTDDDVSEGVKFVPMPLVTLDTFDIYNARFEIRYSGSDPTGVTGTGTPAPGGKLRVWKKDGSVARNAASALNGGDYIAPGVYTAAQLGIDMNTQESLLWVEAVGATGPTDNRQIEVVVYTSGTIDCACGCGSIKDSVYVTAEGVTQLPGAITGSVFDDWNRNGQRDGELVAVGTPPAVVFVIDVSSSTWAKYRGLTVGDINGDKYANSVLDGELEAFRTLNQNLIERGFGETAKVSVVVFGDTATRLDMDPNDEDFDPYVSPAFEINNPLGSNVTRILKNIVVANARNAETRGDVNVGESTYYEQGLQMAIEALGGLGAVPGQGNVIFLSDGMPDDANDFQNEVTAIRGERDPVTGQYAVNLRAFGASIGPDADPLVEIDPRANVFHNAPELLGTFGTTYSAEPPLGGWRVFADLNQDGDYDPDEPFAESDRNNDGRYTISGLTPGQYRIVEVVKPGWIQTAPAGTPKYYDVTIEPGQVVTGKDFGNAYGSTPGVAPDLDIDSDDNNGKNLPDRNVTEDLVEGQFEHGKVIYVNAEDKDADGVLDLVDGYNRDPNATVDDSNANESFTPMVLDLTEIVDLTHAKVRFAYSGSNPAKASTNGDLTQAPGHLRIWRVDGNQTRTVADFITSGQSYDVSHLGLGQGNKVSTLWIEAVRGTNARADQTIRVEIDPDGDGSWTGSLSDVVYVKPLAQNTITIAATTADSLEGSPTPLVFTLTRDLVGGDDALSVYYDITGSALSGWDYAPLNGVATFAAGSTTTTITVVPANDPHIEQDEEVTLTLKASTSYRLGAATSATGLILDNDNIAGLPVITVQPVTETAREDAGPLVFEIRRSSGTGSLTVAYSLFGTAAGGQDYVTPATTEVTFAAGETAKQVSITLTDDAVGEYTETVSVRVVSGNGYTVGNPSQVTQKITDTDGGLLPVVTIVATDPKASERGPNFGTFEIRRAGDFEGDLTVHYSIGGTADKTSDPAPDYKAIASSVVIPNGARSVTLDIEPVQDSAAESMETVILSLQTNSNYEIGVIDTPPTVEIADMAEVPKPPTGLDAGYAGQYTDKKRIGLKWSPVIGVSGLLGYDVHRSTDPDFMPSAATLVGTSLTTRYTDDILATTTSVYHYRVIAVFDSFDGREVFSPPSVKASVVTSAQPTSPPDAASGLAEGPKTSQSVELKWQDNSLDEAEFQILRADVIGTTAGTFSPVGRVTADATDWTDTTVIAGSNYRYRVIAYNVASQTPATNASNDVDVTIPVAVGAPGAPVLAPTATEELTDTENTEKQLQISWTPATGSTGVLQYHVYRKEGSDGAFVRVTGDTPVSITTFLDTHLKSGSSYTYMVRTMEDGVPSPLSAQQTYSTSPASLKPHALITKPGSVSGATGLQGDDKSLVIKDQRIKSRRQVRGIIGDLNGVENLQSWTLTLDPVDVAGSTSLQAIPLTTGTKPVGSLQTGEDGLLFTLDPTLYPTGDYDIVLTAIDTNNNAAKESRVRVSLFSDIKLGSLTLPFTDMSVEVPGSDPITVNRVYDSQRVNESSPHLGNGWSLDFGSAQVRTTARPISQTDSRLAFRAGDLVYVTLPGGRQHTFQFWPVPFSYDAMTWADPYGQSSPYTRYWPMFAAVDGGDANLIVPGDVNELNIDARDSLLRSGDLFLNEFASGQPYFAIVGKQYAVRTRSDVTYSVDAAQNTLSIKNARDEVTQIDSSGVTSGNTRVELRAVAGGWELVQRDVTDPDPLQTVGQPVLYRMSSGGRLQAVTGRDGQMTEYFYDDLNFPDHLTRIVDPRGVDALKAKYDDKGRLIEIRDALDRPVPINDGPFDGSQVMQSAKDPTGNLTETIYDDRGNVIRTIQAVKGANGDIVEYVVNVTQYLFYDPGQMYYGRDLTEMLFDLVETYKGPFGTLQSGTIAQNALSGITTFAPFTVSAAEAEARYTRAPSRTLRSVSFNVSPDTGIDPSNRQIQFESSWDANGVEQKTQYGAYKLGRPQIVTDPDGRVTYFKYDDDGNLEWTVNALGEGTRYKYTTNATRGGVPYTYKGALQSTSLAGLPAGMLLETIRIFCPNPQVAFAQTPTAPTMTELSTARADSANYYYLDDASLGSRRRLKATIDVSGQKTVYAYDARGNASLTARLWFNPNPAEQDRWVVSESLFDNADRVIETREAVYADAGESGATASDKVLNWQLDSYGKPEITEPVYRASRRLSQTHYDAAGQVDWTKDEYEGQSTSRYNDRGQVIETQSPDGTVVRTVYDALGRTILVTDRFKPEPNGTNLATRTVYDSVGRVVQTQRVADVAITIEPDGTAGLFKITGVTGGGLVLEVVAQGTPNWTLDPAFDADDSFSETQTFYNDEGAVDHTIDAAGTRTNTLYFSNGQVKKTVSAVGTLNETTTEYKYNLGTEQSRYDEVIDGRNNSTKTYKDALGRAIKTVYDDGSFTEMFHGVGGKPAVALAGTNIATPAAITATGGIPAGGQHVVKIEQRKSTDTIIVATHYVYDASGKLLHVWQPAVIDATATDNPATPNVDERFIRPHWQYEYDENGNQKSQIDPRGKTTSFAYDEHGRRTSRTLPSDGNAATNDTETWTYDSRGRVRTHVDFKGQSTVYEYDNSAATGGRLTDEYRFAAGQTPLHATTGAILVDDAAEQTYYHYDDLGRQDAVTDLADLNDGDPDLDPTYAVSHGFDEKTGAIIWTTESLNGVAISTVRHSYDPATGRLLATWTGSELDPTVADDTAYTFTAYEYNYLGQLHKVTAKRIGGVTPSTPQVTEYIYDTVGNLDLLTLPNGLAEDYLYDDLNRLDKLTVKRGSTTVFYQDYDVRSDGQRTGVSETREDGSTVRTDWAYDNLDRLIGETYNSSDNSQDYTDTFAFDFAGNRSSRIHDDSNPAKDETIAYTYNDRDQLTLEDSTISGNDKTYGYDPNGSQTSVTTNGSSTVKYVWDLRNRMTGVDSNGDNDTADNGDINYTYDNDGNRISRVVVGGASTYYLLDKQNPTGYAKAIEEKLSPTGSPVRSYLLGLDVIGQYDDAMSGTLYLMKDGYGTTRALVNATGGVVERYDFDAFGNKVKFVDSSGTDLTGDPLTTWLMPDGYRDFATSFDRTELRDVNGRSGRMLSVDPRGNVLGDTLNANLYVYASGNPIYYADPTGLATYAQTAAIGLAAILTGITFVGVQGLKGGLSEMGNGGSFKYGFKRGVDDFLSTWVPWGVYDETDWFLPSMPLSIVSRHKGDILWHAQQQGVPPILVATVLLTELRHYNVADSLTWDNDDSSIGIAQIRIDTIQKHMTARPDLYPNGGMTQAQIKSRLLDPYNAIDLLARDIRYFNEQEGANLANWDQLSSDEKRRHIVRFVSAKDNDSLSGDPTYGKDWGLKSYDVLQSEQMFK